MTKIDPIVLVYPFVAGARIEGESKGHVLGGDCMKSFSSCLSQLHHSRAEQCTSKGMFHDNFPKGYGLLTSR